MNKIKSIMIAFAFMPIMFFCGCKNNNLPLNTQALYDTLIEYAGSLQDFENHLYNSEGVEIESIHLHETNADLNTYKITYSNNCFSKSWKFSTIRFKHCFKLWY